MARWVCLAAALGVVLAVTPAGADPVRMLAQAGAAEPEPGSPKAVERAKKHFERARAAYGMGSYKAAIDELKIALRYDPNGKDLVYNLALVHEKLGNVELAIDNFKRYIEMEDDPKERDRVDQIVQRLEGAREEIKEDVPVVAVVPSDGDDGKQPSTAPSTPGETAKNGRLDGWVYATGGVAIAAAVVGAVFGVRALSTRPGDSDTTGGSTTPKDLRDRNVEAHNLAVVADVCFAISLVSASAAGFLYFSREAEPTANGATGTRTWIHAGVHF